MGTVQSVILNLPVEEAKRFKRLKDDEKDILAMFLASWLSDDNDKIDMKAIMDFIGYRAQQRGLTEEIFSEIMNEEHP